MVERERSDCKISMVLTDGGPQDGHGEEEGGGEENSQVDQQGAHHVVHSVHLYTIHI
jgi:hypothetical protein